MKVKIEFRAWTCRSALSVEIHASYEGTAAGVKLGAAVKAAFRSGADLRDAVLRDADLRGAVLRGADLSDALLCGALLRDADLRGADLSDAVLRDAVLRDADLRGADLRGALLRGADLSGADLRGADLSGADLSDAVLSDAVLSGAVLSGADLSDAVLSDADLRGAVLSGVPKIGKIDAAILAAVKAAAPKPGVSPPDWRALKMDTWHTCETSHCRAGWAVVLAGEAGAKLEAKIGTQAAGTLIYLASRPDKPLPDFFCSDAAAMADLEACAAEQEAVP